MKKMLPIIVLFAMLLPTLAQAQEPSKTIDSAVTTNHLVVLMDAFDDGTGVKEMSWSFDMKDWCGWTDYQSEATIDITNQPEGILCFYPKFKDYVEHETPLDDFPHACIVKDTEPPYVKSVTILNATQIPGLKITIEYEGVKP